MQNNSAAQEQLDQELDKLEKKETSTAVYSEFDEQFRAFGILALLLLIFEICIFDRRSPLLKRLSLFGSKKQTAVMLLLLVATSAAAQSDRQYIHSSIVATIPMRRWLTVRPLRRTPRIRRHLSTSATL